MTELAQLVDIAASLSITATSPDALMLADRQRMEAWHAIEQEQLRLDKMRAILALFPAPMPGNDRK